MKTIVLLLAIFVGLLGILRGPAAPVNTDEIERDGGKWIRLKDGRVVEYFEAGNPNGTPVIAAHSYGNTARSYAGLNAPRNEVYKKYNLRVISLSYPGFGLSDSLPVDAPRSVGTWVKTDVMPLLDHLEIDKFYTIGESFGGLHAVGIAANSELSPRVLGVGCFAPVVPAYIGDHLEELEQPATRITKKLLGAPYIGDLLAYLFSGLDTMTRFNCAPDIRDALIKIGEVFGMEFVDFLIEDGSRSCKHTYRGWTDNVAQMNALIDYDIENVAYIGGDVSKPRTVVVTTAADDGTNPPAMQRWVARQIPNAKLLEIPAGWAHLHFMIPEVFETIAAELFVAPESASTISAE